MADCVEHFEARAGRVGRIEVIAGCMFAGKTAALIDRLLTFQAAGMRVIAVTHELDQRRAFPVDANECGVSHIDPPRSAVIDLIRSQDFDWKRAGGADQNRPEQTTDSSGALLRTHDGRSFAAVSLVSAAQIATLVERSAADVIAIDEAQFFDAAVVSLCDRLRRAGYTIVAAGIHHNAWGRPFSPLPELIAIADSTEIRTVPCKACGTPAEFTQRVTPIVAGNMIGGTSDYEPRCAACFQALPGSDDAE